MPFILSDFVYVCISSTIVRTPDHSIPRLYFPSSYFSLPDALKSFHCLSPFLGGGRINWTPRFSHHVTWYQPIFASAVFLFYSFQWFFLFFFISILSTILFFLQCNSIFQQRMGWSRVSVSRTSKIERKRVLKLAIVKRCSPQSRASEMEFTPIHSAHSPVFLDFSVSPFVTELAFCNSVCVQCPSARERPPPVPRNPPPPPVFCYPENFP